MIATPSFLAPRTLPNDIIEMKLDGLRSQLAAKHSK